MAVTARIGGEQGDPAYQWTIEYDDSTRRVTAQATADPAIVVITVLVKLTATLTAKVQFCQPTRPPDADTDYPVTFGAGLVAIGPAVNANQVARIVGKPGALGGLTFEETPSRV